jgi:hypothetical protein
VESGGPMWSLDLAGPEVWVSPWDMDPAVLHGAGVWQVLRGRETRGMDQCVQGLIRQGLGQPVVVLVDCGMEKPSTI